MDLKGTFSRPVEVTCPKHGKYIAEQAIVSGQIVHTSQCPKCKEERLNSPEFIAEQKRKHDEAEALERKRTEDAKKLTLPLCAAHAFLMSS